MAKKKSTTPEDLKELKQILSVEDKIEKIKEVPIIFDKKQYSVKIPKKFADTLNIDTKKDVFFFKLEVPLKQEKRPKLSGEVVRNEKISIQ